MKNTQQLPTQAQHIRLLICDVDGVLTDGKLCFDNQGGEYKSFHSQDGLGLKLLQRHGIEIAIITARHSNIVAKRMQELGITHVYQGREDKFTALQSLQQTLGIDLQHMAYIGDDLPDVKPIVSVGLGIAVANAVPFVKQQADWVTQRAGGHAAVREVAELILHHQQKLEAAYAQYLSE